jgi:hypothetical protein
MRRRSEEQDFTIILTTRSPVVMNEFRDEPEQVFVLDRSDPSRALPVVMTDLHSEEWLAQSKDCKARAQGQRRCCGPRSLST